ncbi:DUF2294 domain-containing protein [Gloeocapsa sp. PCC 73106]|uniref:DUF2294 domain-containing protein n=1 Tax=Gloeocapsa sp. PCC 73106 TaxID=102232 RepID=UPI0002ACB953|nr:DUF2294 domain-containing protein [Gloeocapsa sp. PCC 73106]ELR98112.1 hypothetical protein GLO73106DRAFT_00019360 [Gloeocapsa sp. PCC 73106]
MSEKLPTCGQLERELSQQIQAFYRDRLGYKPSKITCQFLDQKVTIILEDSLTPAEQLLAEDGQKKLAQEVRSCLNELTKPQIIELIETILKVKVDDLLSDVTLDTARTGMIAILADNPQVRNPAEISKGSSSKSSVSKS